MTPLGSLTLRFINPLLLLQISLSFTYNVFTLCYRISWYCCIVCVSLWLNRLWLYVFAAWSYVNWQPKRTHIFMTGGRERERERKTDREKGELDYKLIDEIFNVSTKYIRKESKEKQILLRWTSSGKCLVAYLCNTIRRWKPITMTFRFSHFSFEALTKIIPQFYAIIYTTQ